MRLLHTSDWHLGRRLHGVDLLDHQRLVLDALVEDVERLDVELVVVAGDVYDRALPPSDAVDLFDDVVHRLGRTRAAVVLTPGNHDSARRLGVHARLLGHLGVHLRCELAGVGEPVVVEDADGPVAVFGLPFLDPASAAAPLGAGARTHAAVHAAALARVHAWLSEHPGHRSVVVAHAFVTGGDLPEESESERALAVGGAAHVPAEVFDGVDYVALGHLHGPQRPGGQDRVAYCGSPLAYSFDEVRQRKGWLLVDLGADGSVTSTWRAAPVPRAMRRLTGRLEELLTRDDLADAEDAWVDVTLTDPQRPAQAMSRLQERFPHALHLSWQPEGGRPGQERTYGERVRGRPPLDVVTGFVADVRERDADAAETEDLAAAVEASLRPDEAAA